MELNPKTKGRDFGLAILLIGIPLLLLSITLTLGFLSSSWGAPSDILSVLAAGAFGYVPAGLLVWAGIRLRKIGFNGLSFILLVMASLCIITTIVLISRLM